MRKQLILRAQLANARFKLKPSTGPTDPLPVELAPIWHEIARAMSISPTTADETYLECLTHEIAHWRTHSGDRATLRDLYRALGHMLVPMSARRALLFPPSHNSGGIYATRS